MFKINLGDFMKIFEVFIKMIFLIKVGFYQMIFGLSYNHNIIIIRVDHSHIEIGSHSIVYKVINKIRLNNNY